MTVKRGVFWQVECADNLQLSAGVRAALLRHAPVVALESTIITHGA